MAVSIILYSQNHERVGETYPRRAKQLVRSGRAFWLEEGNSLMLTSYSPAKLHPHSHAKEAALTMTESMYTSNDTTPEGTDTPRPTGHSELLMYLAHKNVTQKRNLFKHIVAYILAWPVLHVLFNGLFWARTTTETQVANLSRNMYEVLMPFQFRQNGFGAFFEGFEAFIENFYMPRVYLENNLGNYLQNVPFFVPHTYSIAVPHSASVSSYYNLWPFIVGVMFAWGIWILARSFVVVRRHYKNKPRAVPRPDPVALEYQRLQHANSGKI